MEIETLELKFKDLDQALKNCTRCGICAEACVTFQKTGWEYESPRGRIHLAIDFLDGKISPDHTALSTFDRCLGCHRCEHACPENVSYSSIRQTVQDLRIALYPHSHFISREYKKWVLLTYRMGIPFWRRYGKWWLLFKHTHLKKMQTTQKYYWNRWVGWLKKTWKDKFLKQKFLPNPHSEKIFLMVGCLQDFFDPELIDQVVSFLNYLGIEAVMKKNQPCCGAIMNACVQSGAEAFGLQSIKEWVSQKQQKRIEIFKKWVPQESYFLDQSCQRFLESKGETNVDLYTRILQEILKQKMTLSVSAPMEVYYQPYCNQINNGEDSICKLLNGIEGLTVKKFPFFKTCCGGYGSELRQVQTENSGEFRITELPVDATIVVTNQICLNYFKQHLKGKRIIHVMSLIFELITYTNSQNK
jgi:glycolate oxidase iron-sulfur subunit